MCSYRCQRGGRADGFAQESTKANEAAPMLDKKNYLLKHALAYETKIDDEQASAVVLSGQAVSSEKLNQAKKRKKMVAPAILTGHT